MRHMTSDTFAFNEDPRSIPMSDHGFKAFYGRFFSSCVVDDRASCLRGGNHVDKVCRFEGHLHPAQVNQ